MNRQKMMENEPVGKLLIKLSVPAGIGMLIQALYNVVDTIFIGRGVGAYAIAGITIIFPLQMLIIALAQTIGIGSSSYISRCLGKKDVGSAEKTLGNAIFLSLISGAMISIVGIIYSDLIINQMGATQDIFIHSKNYMEIILLGTIFSSFSMVANNIVRAEGNAYFAMITMLISGLLNIILDAFFIFVLKMGVQGAAIATVISQITTALYLIWYFMANKSLMEIKLKNFKLDYPIVREIMVIGISSFVRMAAGSFIGILLNRTLGFYGGSMSIAVMGVIHRVLMFTFMPLLGIAQGLQPILGFNYGAKRFDRAREVINYAVFYATIISVISFILVMIFPRQIFNIFSKDIILIDQGSRALRIVVLASVLIGFQVVGSTVFQAIGKAIPAFILSVSRQVLFLIPLLIILPKFYHLNGIWMTHPLADIMSFIVTLLLFLKQISKFKKEEKIVKAGEY